MSVWSLHEHHAALVPGLDGTAPVWHCVHTEPRREEFAACSLTAGGFQIYLPRYQRWVRHARKRALVARPLFPRYLFVRPRAQGGPIGRVCRTPGVAALVGDRGAAAIVPPDVIAALRSREDTAGLIDLDNQHFRPGQRVRMLAGPFAGFEAIFNEAEDRRRALVLVELLGKAHRLRVPTHEIEPAI